jgi:peroxiredoxin
MLHPAPSFRIWKDGFVLKIDLIQGSRCLLGLLLLSAVLGGSGPAVAAYQLGDTVADFTLDDLSGTPTNLSDFAGDIIVLNFFATWCPGCNVEAAILENNIHQAYREYGVTVIAIDMQEQLAIVQNWATSQGVTYKILLSPDWDIFSLFPQAGGLPYNAIIDRDMVLRYARILFDETAIVSTLNALLGFDPVADEARSFSQIKALYR